METSVRKVNLDQVEAENGIPNSQHQSTGHPSAMSAPPISSTGAGISPAEVSNAQNQASKDADTGYDRIIEEYHLHRPQLSAMHGDQDSLSDELQSDSGGRRKSTPPSRAVFQDLLSAHSSITSRAVRRHPRNGSNKYSVGDEEESSIPLQDMEPAIHDGNTYPPMPPPSTVFFHARTIIDSNEEPGMEHDNLHGSQYPATVSSSAEIHHPTPRLASHPSNIESMFHAASQGPDSGHWPRDSIELKRQSLHSTHSLKADENDQKNRSAYGAEAKAGLQNDVPLMSSGQWMGDDRSIYHSHLGAAPSGSAPQSSHEGSGIRDVSSHGSQYQGRGQGSMHGHLENSTPGEGQSSSLYNSKAKVWANEGLTEGSTVGNIYKHYEQSSQYERSGASMHDAVSHNLINTREGYGPASDYASQSGSQNGLQPSALTIRKHRRDAARDRSSQGLHEGSIPNSNNPYRTNMPPAVLVSSATESGGNQSGDGWKPTSEERLPLEREVSEALRRASGYSFYSIGSAGSSAGVYYEESKGRPSASSSGGYSLKRSENKYGRSLAPGTQGFYDSSAIHSGWIGSRHRNAVRVPINHNGAQAESPPQLASGRPALPLASKSASGKVSDDDGNDWETIAESFRGHGVPSMLGGYVGRAGSSIADYSDDDITTTGQDPDLYGSTERIIQHPGANEYSGDYQQRDVKKSKVPVLLPVFGEHKVNGYLSDSLRTKPRQKFFNKLKPLERSHANPFRSPPPEVMANTRSGARQQYRKYRAQLPNHFPPSRTLDTIDSEPTTHDTPLSKPPAVVAPSGPNWMDDFTEPGPAVRYVSQPVLGRSPQESERPSSWLYVMQKAGVFDRHDDRKDGFVEVPLYGGKSTNRNNRNSSGKLPPGTFYRDLRSASGQAQCSPSNRRKRSTKKAGRNHSQEYPTNVLRPLSLSDGLYPEAPEPFENAPTRNAQPGDFIYRSPLAPPKRKSWRNLYTEAHLNDIREAAKADGVYDSSSQASLGLLQDSGQPGLSQRHLAESPRLITWSLESTDLSRSMRKKYMISNGMFFLCNLLPPLLILFSHGYLDGLMPWLSNGEFSRFGRGQKTLANLALCVYGFLTIVALVIIVVLAIQHKL